MSATKIHRRKSSREEDDNVLLLPNESTSPPASQPVFTNGTHPNGNGLAIPSPSRSRVVSTPPIPTSQSYPSQPASAGPYRTNFSLARPPALNGSRHPAPAMRQSFSLPTTSHSRTRSVSGPFSPISPSPLSSSFPSHQLSMPNAPKFPSSSTAPELHTPSTLFENGISAGSHPRRHARIHSRNLSVFFPRPGSLPSTTISEDGTQELDLNDHSAGIPMPSASPGPGQRSFREGFTFGAPLPSASTNSTSPNSASSMEHPMPAMSSGATSRRGHHHKHSLSHNFFSFLEPGDLHTQPTPVPLSPWAPISPFPHSPPMDGEVSVSVTKGTRTRTGTESEIGKIRADPGIMPSAVAIAGGQFLLGAWLWVAGQQVGSLACTGLGYWVVFDAFGVALGHILPGYLARPSKRAEVRRPFGNARIETVMTFAQTVYLIFTSVYVCKETVEHLLLSSGEGHHHHHGDEVTSVYGIDFPISLLVLTLFSLLMTAIPFDNHAKLVSTAGNHIPPLTTLLPSRSRYRALSYAYPTRLSNLLSNPYTLSPILFSASIICTSVFVSPRQHRPIDLILAAVETVITFSLAYPAAVALGAVLLQTSPARGLAGGRMEAFLRAMREIERHPQVLHLPAPHIWQLTPSLAFSDAEHTSPYAHPPTTPAKPQGPAQSLVVTLELHVRQDLENDEVLRLTRWAWERCVHALHFGTRGGEGGEGEAEVTVGIVRG